MRSVQQFTAAKPAQGALGLIGEEHTVAEDALVQPGAHGDLGVPTYGIERRTVNELIAPLAPHELVHGHDELMLARLFVDKPDRAQYTEDSGRDADEPDDWRAELHREPERNVVVRRWVGTLPLVPGVPLLTDRVVVRATLGSGNECGEDAQRDQQILGLPDAPLPRDQREPVALEHERLSFGAAYEPAGPLLQTFEVSKRSGTHALVQVGDHPRRMIWRTVGIKAWVGQAHVGWPNAPLRCRIRGGGGDARWRCPAGGSYTMHWFDSVGIDPGAPARGHWEGNTLTFVHRDTGFGMSRYTYIVGEGEYGLRIENFADGSTWSTFLEGTYRRSNPTGPADRSA